jgi:ubiquinone/menaquinone biosynthesis C-methylase UbiE
MTESKAMQDYVTEMKRDWNDRARENAMWYINTFKVQQTDDEFEATCQNDIDWFVLADLPALTWCRDPRSLKLLELGCGIGRMSRKLAAIFGEIHGIDVSGEMICRARERLQDVPNAFFHETSGVDFRNFADETFDVIFSAYVFQHVPDKSVILSNIRDGYRVLKPGGVFKFMAAGITNAEYQQMPKNTWTGAPFVQADSRAIALELGAQLVSVIGEGTQYFWTVLRKPQRQSPAISSQIPAIMQAGRADDLSICDVPARGDKAYIGLRLQGFNPEIADCNQLKVRFRDKELLPVYAGPAGGSAPGAIECIQINVPVPTDDDGGSAEIAVLLPDGKVSSQVNINVLPPEPVAPFIFQYSNAQDAGLDIYTRGPKSMIRVFALGFDELATPDNVRMHVGEINLTPISISFLPANGAWMITAQLPPDTRAQETDISVSYHGRRSQSLSLPILKFEEAAVESL